VNLFELDKEVVSEKTVRVLVYPNITFQEDLSKDSYIQVIKQQITQLNLLRSDLWFYLILPCPVPSLDFQNVTQWYLPFPTYPQTMRSHVDVFSLQKMLGPKWDFDLVMSHLPEHTHALKNILYNVTHHIPAFFGYAHWFDLKQVVTWSKDSFVQNITGLLEYDRCYINTQYQKGLVLDQACETLNPSMINKLDDILEVQPLGVNNMDITSDINETPEKIIVFNHRPDTYKNFKGFMAVCDELWKIRQDFKVWIPLLDKPNRDYVVTDKGDKAWYYKRLKDCYVGFSPKQTYGGWSVSTTDGMMMGVPYILYDAPYYHELYAQGDFFENDLDDPQYRNEEASKARDWIENNLVYFDEVVKMNYYMIDLLSRQKVMGDSEKLKEIIAFIQKNGSVTKKEIMEFVGWGRGIKWTPYRRALMDHPNVYDVYGAEPIYQWKEGV
jgi:glycosyltransferase involved in cell wall biosynthesis